MFVSANLRTHRWLAPAALVMALFCSHAYAAPYVGAGLEMQFATTDGDDSDPWDFGSADLDMSSDSWVLGYQFAEHWAAEMRAGGVFSGESDMHFTGKTADAEIDHYASLYLRGDLREGPYDVSLYGMLGATQLRMTNDFFDQGREQQAFDLSYRIGASRWWRSGWGFYVEYAKVFATDDIDIGAFGAGILYRFGAVE